MNEPERILCVGCGVSLPERETLDGRCPDCRAKPRDRKDMTLGEVAFQAYLDTPTSTAWRDMSPRIQAAWEAAAQAVVEEALARVRSKLTVGGE